MKLAIALLGAYLVGGIPVSYLTAKYVAGIDLRKQGSGNLGATNLYRVLGLKYAVPVALLDVLKGALPVVLLAPRVGAAPWIPLALGAAAIVGHVFPVYLGFKGGKGVATAAGAVLAVAPIPLLTSVGVWAFLLATTGIMSLASIAAAITFPVAARFFLPENQVVFVAGLMIAAFIVMTHRSNIARLLKGTEPRVSRGRQREA